MLKLTNTSVHFALVLVCIGGICHAGSIETTDGSIYKDVTVIEKTVLWIKITHTTGIARIEVLNLKPEDQKKYGCDPSVAQKILADKAKKEEERKDVERIEKEAQTTREAAERKMAETIKQTQLEAEAMSEIMRLEKETKRALEERRSNCRMVGNTIYDFSPVLKTSIYATEKRYAKYGFGAKIVQVLDDGLLVEGSNTHLYERQLFFVTDSPAQATAIDGKAIAVLGFPSGRYQYINTLGARMTILKFTSARDVDRTFKDDEIKPLP